MSFLAGAASYSSSTDGLAQSLPPLMPSNPYVLSSEEEEALQLLLGGFRRGRDDVSLDDVLAVQAKWADAIKTISSVYVSGGDYVDAAAKAAGDLYDYGNSKVLFEPAKATAESAMSYFVGGSALPGGCGEDAGFAINGGKGWSNVVFQNHHIELCGITAIAMGTYYFTSAADSSKAKVEYAFGYKKNENSKVRIFLHHSSVPYSIGAGCSCEPSCTIVGQHSFWRRRFEQVFGRRANDISLRDVLDAQANWANTIKTISSIYLSGGNYIGAASHAEDELYGYGHANVLFKPTKAAKYPFRPTVETAISYLIVASAGQGSYNKDVGFAFKGVKGGSNVVFQNRRVEVCGRTAIATGSYFFTSAADASETEVEYTFGYRKNEDGKVRIFLHHSSVPYSTTTTPTTTPRGCSVVPAAPAPTTEASKKAEPAIKDVRSDGPALMTEAHDRRRCD